MVARCVLLWMVFGLLTLSGCTIIPGSDLKLGTQALPDNAEVDLDGKLNVFAITPELEARLQAPPVVPGSNPDLNNSLQKYDYLVGPGDVLAITIWEHPELMNPNSPRPSLDQSAAGATSPVTATNSNFPGYVIGSDGNLFYPYVGMLNVSGLSVREVRKVLKEKLSRYIPDPQIDVSVSSFHSQHVYVTGEVKAPGALPLTNVPLTLLDAVGFSGGILPTADWDHVKLTRQGHEYEYSLRNLYKWGDINQNTILQPNDVVWVPPSLTSVVFMFGELGKQQSVPILQSGLTLADALAQSGGINQLTANASGVFVLRKSPSNNNGKLIDVYQLNIKQAPALVLADAFPLQPRDIVFITAAPLTRWNKVINLLLPNLDFLYLGTETHQTILNTK